MLKLLDNKLLKELLLINDIFFTFFHFSYYQENYDIYRETFFPHYALDDLNFDG